MSKHVNCTKMFIIFILALNCTEMFIIFILALNCTEMFIILILLSYLCASVLDLDAFERTNKAEGLGMSADTNKEDKTEFTCKLFRFLQLLCEGHNLGEQGFCRPNLCESEILKYTLKLQKL